MSVLRTLCLVGVMSLALGSGGCLFGSHTKETHTGNYVQPSTFDQIKPGVTSGFVEATLGKPDTKTPVKDDNSEIWKWAYTERKESAGYVFLIFAGSDNHETKHAAYVQVKDGQVVKAWRG